MEKAQEYGIKVEEKSKYRTSGECLFCHTKGVRRHRGLFYCRKCNMTMNADAIGALNIARKDAAIIPSLIIEAGSPHPSGVRGRQTY